MRCGLKLGFRNALLVGLQGVDAESNNRRHRFPLCDNSIKDILYSFGLLSNTLGEWDLWSFALFRSRVWDSQGPQQRDPRRHHQADLHAALYSHKLTCILSLDLILLGLDIDDVLVAWLGKRCFRSSIQRWLAIVWTDIGIDVPPSLLIFVWKSKSVCELSYLLATRS